MEIDEILGRCEVCEFISQESNVRQHMRVHQSPVELDEDENYSHCDELTYNTSNQNDGEEVEIDVFQEENAGIVQMNKNDDTSDIQFSSPDVQLDQRITEPQEESHHIICSKDCKTKKFEDQLERLKKDFADIKDTIKRVMGAPKKYQHQNKNNSKSVEKAGKTSNLCNGFTVEVIDESLNENVNPSPYKNVTLPEGGLLNLDKTFPAEEKNGQNELEDEYLNAQDNAKIGSPSSSNQQKRILVIGDEYESYDKLYWSTPQVQLLIRLYDKNKLKFTMKRQETNKFGNLLLRKWGQSAN
ncbi:hypothetical protein JTB14_032258 [Gonioctena quinquepunctata]|nr:hypothetical protein JTB14_032258 [Gonioctena quinquepunctata]